ncbi:MAG: hypothetical protein H5T96_03910 [Tissierellales bacterium]|nr:hypothetical protein [Tissierellales bacterium]
MKEEKNKYQNWIRLDNASKIFPATYTNRDTKVFRISVELFDYVDKDILQKAIDEAVLYFPVFNYVLRRGVFWYYFEYSNLKPTVEIESTPLCAPLYDKEKRNLLYRITYYNKRINLEAFHALTDGAGVVWFMETIVHLYLTKKYSEEFKDKNLKLRHKAAISQMMDDSFSKYYNKDKSIVDTGTKVKKAYQIKGTYTEENITKLIEGTVSTKKIVDLAHKYNSTVTVFLTSLLIYSIIEYMPSKYKKNPISVSVPINLRQYFKSYTARNFFSTMNIIYYPTGDDDIEKITSSVRESFKSELTKENLSAHLNRLISIEKNPLTRIVPLPLKDLVLRFANKFADRGITTSFSNVGKIELPQEFEPYVNKFSICVSARRPQVVSCSYRDKMVICFISPFEETDIQRTFFTFLSENGIDVEIISNF